MDKYLGWLGWKVRDKVSGINGVVTSISVDLYGCIQAIVSPTAVVDKSTGVSKIPDAHWFDMTRLERLGKAPVMERIVPREVQSPGGYAKPLR